MHLFLVIAKLKRKFFNQIFKGHQILKNIQALILRRFLEVFFLGATHSHYQTKLFSCGKKTRKNDFLTRNT